MNTSRIAKLLQPFLAGEIGNAGSLSSTRNGLDNRSEAKLSEHGRGAQNDAREPSPELSAAQLQSISTYIDILLRWNARINLTAVRHPEEIVTRHFGESLFAARSLFPGILPVATGDSPVQAEPTEGNNKVNTRVADLGSGAGFPGLPMKLWAPQIALTLIESNHKKAAFLREVTRALTLTDVDIENVRAETLMPNSFDVVTLRAVERFENILPIASKLVAPAGCLALLLGAAQGNQARSLLPDFSLSAPLPIPRSRSRVLLLARCDAKTDEPIQ